MSSCWRLSLGKNQCWSVKYLFRLLTNLLSVQVMLKDVADSKRMLTYRNEKLEASVLTLFALIHLFQGQKNSFSSVRDYCIRLLLAQTGKGRILFSSWNSGRTIHLSHFHLTFAGSGRRFFQRFQKFKGAFSTLEKVSRRCRSFSLFWGRRNRLQRYSYPSIDGSLLQTSFLFFQATLIYAFQEKREWTVPDLAARLGCKEEYIQSKMRYWLNQHVVLESNSTYSLISDASAMNEGNLFSRE